MNYFKTYYFIKVLALIALTLINYEYWDGRFLWTLVISVPYIIIFTIAHKDRYKGSLRYFIRTLAGIVVFLLALGILYNESAIGSMYAIVIQYSVIFASEAIIALFTYDKDYT
ncbi:hypothetical protein [Thalassotalea sp. PP2-459]|uniref:hypothetical protein n=1 Tax=Thalassotalea sp. PP2-459 TaxID=1742724 RepID=UPI0009451081|nr:hypothetical protein [Thalassotalea sp. PP2-459]OKY26602.1 hypothetical protein BI291_00965 [Thalassotalea sp. PP2-459]